MTDTPKPKRNDDELPAFVAAHVKILTENGARVGLRPGETVIVETQPDGSYVLNGGEGALRAPPGTRITFIKRSFNKRSRLFGMVKSVSGQPVIAYFRVSTTRQGQSGLGLEAQRAAVAAHLAHTKAPLVAEFTEIETGTRKKHRPELAQALIEARASGAVLVIARFDRLARDVQFLSTLMNSDVAFRALDLPGASRFTLHVLAAVAEKEASDISERTKAALQAAKARGTKLGNPKNLTDVARRRSLAVRRTQAAARHRLVLPLVMAWDQLGWPLQKMADQLTELRVPQPRLPRAGQAPKPWQFVQVRRLVALARREQAATA